MNYKKEDYKIFLKKILPWRPILLYQGENRKSVKKDSI